jgi:phosphoglycerate dehydrogenase-like enzyme
MTHTPEQPASPAAGDRPRVVIAVDLPEELCARIEQAEPRVEVVRDRELYRPRRFPADWEGDPAHERTPAQQERFERMIDSADVLFSLPDVLPAQLARTAEANPRLRWVMTMAAGGGSQLRAAGLTPDQLERIAVTTSAGTHGGPLAEFALLGVLAGAKTLPRLRVLVVGLGGIGRACAALLHAVGATVLGTTRSGAPVEGVDELVPIEDLAAAAADVDAIVVTLPGTETTTGLVGEEVLGAVRPGTVLVNVGRGTVVDELALLGALEDGRIGFAALDVFASEPLATTSPLWDHPNVLVSPHTAALDRREEERIVEQFIANLRRFLDGEELANRVDTVEFY